MNDELEAIRARHEADCGFESDSMDSAEWRAALTMLATRAHADRATLLRLLDATREAAKPFIREEEHFLGRPDEIRFKMLVKIGDLRRLAAALK
jgi:hypothetical protein